MISYYLDPLRAKDFYYDHTILIIHTFVTTDLVKFQLKFQDMLENALAGMHEAEGTHDEDFKPDIPVKSHDAPINSFSLCNCIKCNSFFFYNFARS